jgi:hypothetical protein
MFPNFSGNPVPNPLAGQKEIFHERPSWILHTKFSKRWVIIILPFPKSPAGAMFPLPPFIDISRTRNRYFYK